MKKHLDFSEHQSNSETVFTGNFINVHRDSVILPDGNEASREVVRHPGAAIIVPLMDTHTVLLEWQFRYPLNQHLLEFPAGKLEPDEAPQLCAKRELLEETGYQARRWDFIMQIHTTPGFSDERGFIYLAQEMEYIGSRPEKGEFISVETVAIDDALTMIKNGEITDAKTIIGLLWLNAYHQTSNKLA